MKAWLELDKVIFNKNLSWSARTVYVVLCGYAMNKDYCYPSIRTLQENLGGSYSTLVKAVEELEKCGAISKEYLNGKNSIYRIHERESVTKIVTPKTVTKSVTDRYNNCNEPLQKLEQTVTIPVTKEHKEEHKEEKIEKGIVASDTPPDVSKEKITEPKQEEKKPTPQVPPAPPSKRFVKPSVEEIKVYMHKIGLNDFESEKFYDWYESCGWKVGKNPMKDWEAACRNWKRNVNNKTQNHGNFQKNQLRPNGIEPDNKFEQAGDNPIVGTLRLHPQRG